MSKFPRPDITLATTIWQFIDFPTDRQTILQKQATFMRIVGLAYIYDIFSRCKVFKKYILIKLFLL